MKYNRKNFSHRRLHYRQVDAERTTTVNAFMEKQDRKEKKNYDNPETPGTLVLVRFLCPELGQKLLFEIPPSTF